MKNYKYQNTSKSWQIIRIKSGNNWLEKAVMPKSWIVFEWEPPGVLEVHTPEIATATLADLIFSDSWEDTN
jgi:hypothetical protein